VGQRPVNATWALTWTAVVEVDVADTSTMTSDDSSQVLDMVFLIVDVDLIVDPSVDVDGDVRR
jgi:hypothetical protein